MIIVPHTKGVLKEIITNVAECEKVYEFEEILNKGTLLYELDKQAILDYDAGRSRF